jgi:hypothetical protein
MSFGTCTRAKRTSRCALAFSRELAISARTAAVQTVMLSTLSRADTGDGTSTAPGSMAKARRWIHRKACQSNASAGKWELRTWITIQRTTRTGTLPHSASVATWCTINGSIKPTRDARARKSAGRRGCFRSWRNGYEVFVEEGGSPARKERTRIRIRRGVDVGFGHSAPLRLVNPVREMDAIFVPMSRPEKLGYARSQFKRGGGFYSRIMTLLKRELRAIDARDVTIHAGFRDGDIRRSDGWPRSDVRPQHPAVALQFRRGTQAHIMVFRSIKFGTFEENLYAIAMTLESLRAVARYGCVEGYQQYSGFRQIEAPATREEKIAALRDNAQTDGERQAAQAALNRLQEGNG